MGPTVICCPVRISLAKGKMTPRKQITKMLTKRKLLRRKRASRESNEVISTSDFRACQRRLSKERETAKVTEIKRKNNGPMALCAKACTEDSTPERVRKVPKITRS